MSASLAELVLDRLAEAGVQEIILCPGGRNAAFVQSLAKSDRFKLWTHFEERSAAYFALGRAKSTGRPAAVIVTSGTAAGELLPAVMEAAYSGVPLILVTADRPRRFRGSGAPQAAVQTGIFGVYAGAAFDLEAGEELPHLVVGQTPIHINVCLEDPNACLEEPRGSEFDSGPAAPIASRIETFFQRSQNPLVIVGSLSRDDQETARKFFTSLRAAVICESLSGLRETSELAGIRLDIPDRVFERAQAAGCPFDGVLRLGGVPTHRIWRDLEDRHARLPVLSISRLPFTGLGRPSGWQSWADSNWSAALPSLHPRLSVLRERDAQVRLLLDQLIHKFPHSEPAFMRRISEAAGEDSFIYLGNSLPIREWDLAADHRRRPSRTIAANRGLNGIDGQVSTFLGMCGPGENWAILGDLTTLYDFAGPWPADQMADEVSWTITTVNNRGGRIFERMFPEREFQNRHDRSFQHWAAHWGIQHQIITRPEDITAAQGRRLLELCPDPDQTAAFWTAWQEALR